MKLSIPGPGPEYAKPQHLGGQNHAPNGVRHKGMEAVHRRSAAPLRPASVKCLVLVDMYTLPAAAYTQARGTSRQPAAGKQLKIINDKKRNKDNFNIYPKGGDRGRVMKNKASGNANTNAKKAIFVLKPITNAASTEGADLVKEDRRDAVAKAVIMVDVPSTPKPPGILKEAGGNKTKTGEDIGQGMVGETEMEVGGVDRKTSSQAEGDERMRVVKQMEKEDRSFVDRQWQGRRNELCEEDVPKYKNVANDHEGIERALCAAYEPLFATIKCEMHCASRVDVF